jgi:hypothetical protein
MSDAETEATANAMFQTFLARNPSYNRANDSNLASTMVALGLSRTSEHYQIALGYLAQGNYLITAARKRGKPLIQRYVPPQSQTQQSAEPSRADLYKMDMADLRARAVPAEGRKRR